MGFYGQSIFEVQDYFSRLETYSCNGVTIDPDTGEVKILSQEEEDTLTFTRENIGPHSTLRFLSDEGHNEQIYPDWINIWLSEDDIIPTIHINHQPPHFFDGIQPDKKGNPYPATPFIHSMEKAPASIGGVEDDYQLKMGDFIMVSKLPIDLRGHVCYEETDKLYNIYQLPRLVWQEYTE